MIRRFIAHLKWRWAWNKWFFEVPPYLDRKRRGFLPNESMLRRQTLRLMRERYHAREPKWEQFWND